MDERQFLDRLAELGLLKTARVDALLEEARVARKRVED